MRLSNLIHIAVAILSGLLLVSVPTSVLTQEYRVHDLEDTGWLTRANWAVRWVYAPMSLRELLPLYAYELCTAGSQGQNSDGACISEDYVESSRELNSFTALVLGARTWEPAEYEVGHAGLVLEPSDSSDNDESDRELIVYNESTGNPTLGEAWDWASDYTSEANQESRWLFVTENPIPDIEPERRFWTHTNRDIINTNQAPPSVQ